MLKNNDFREMLNPFLEYVLTKGKQYMAKEESLYFWRDMGWREQYKLKYWNLVPKGSSGSG